MRDAIRENGAVTGVDAPSKDGTMHEFHAPITIDASGRDAFFTYAQQLEDSRRLSEQDRRLDLL